MNPRRSLISLALAFTFAAPLGALADDFFVPSLDEAGTRIVNPVLGQRIARVTPDPAPPLRTGTVSRDGQYLYSGDEGGWQLRPMEYRFVNGRLAHVDEPAGHMNRLADTSPETAAQKTARANSRGS
jgi:hypothetical protein